MQAYKLVFILLVVGGVLASFFMLPSREELALMYLQERELVQAQAIYTQMAEKSQLERENLSPLTRIYIAQGQPQHAIAVYENYLKAKPDDFKVQAQLAKLYFHSQRFYDYMLLLETMVEAQPNTHYFTELASLYRQFGQAKKEMAVLEHLLSQNPSDVESVQRLIPLQAAAGDYFAAEQSLALYLQAGNKLTDDLAELRLRLFISAGDTDAALAWAEEWLQQHRASTSRFVAALYSGGVSSRMQTAAKMSPATAPAKMSPWLIRAVVRVAWQEKMPDFLTFFASQLNKERQAEFPVIMAKVALATKNSDLIALWLTRAEQLASLDSGQMQDMLDIYLATKNIEGALEMLASLARETATPAEVFSNAAAIILALNESAKGFAFFDDLKKHHSHHGIEYAWALFSAAQGESEFLSWFAKGNSQPLLKQQWQDIYFAASDKAHHLLAIDIARHMHQLFQGLHDLQLLAQALLKAGLSSEALRLLEQPLSSPSLPAVSRRELAFLLLEVEEKQAAVQQFQLLAASQGPQGIDVKHLLFIWGPLPDESALAWLEHRAKTASPETLGGWWQLLVQLGAADRVLAMGVNTQLELMADAQQVLASALAAKGERVVAAKKLRAQATKTRDIAQLESLAQLASNQDMRATEEFIWRRVFQLQPQNPKANRSLGLAAFRRDDRRATESHLARYVKSGRADWQSEFYLAEAIYADGRQNNAKKHFLRSLDQINKAGKLKKQQRLARALMHYRLGKMKTALNEYDRLIADFPKDKELRANYSTLLIDEGRLDKARHLLGDKL